jgi:hypothetical protein
MELIYSLNLANFDGNYFKVNKEQYFIYIFFVSCL